MFLARRLAAIVASAILITVAPLPLARCQTPSTENDPVQGELAAMNKPGVTVARAREQVLVILQTENACSAWFRQTTPDSAEVFRSLHYEIEQDRPSYVSRITDAQGRERLKHPWGARSAQNAGRNSLIELNTDGPFFSSVSLIMQVDPAGALVRPNGYRVLTVAAFRGNTTEGRVTILLHELGHIVGRLPEDADSWDGHSLRNTEEVLRHCKHDIRATAQKISREEK
jgi:hypothetical protein